MTAPSYLDPVAVVKGIADDPFATSRLQPLPGVGLSGEPTVLSAAGRATSGAPADFGALVSAGLVDTNNRLNAAETALQSLAVGGAGNLHTVMVSMEGAKLAFQLVAQVRNHLLTAYQDVVKMQI